ncbi:MAG: hypothetical protein U9R25_19485 [Chloroflexota bacterium]|nr:hypothetical protein [Chloroflexota bacterium]
MVNQPIGLLSEEDPPRFLRAQALPYPELKRVWARIELTQFNDSPTLELTILDEAGYEQASMVMVDVQHTYISLTMHLKNPLPGSSYRLILRLLRDNSLLDERVVPFDLVFVEKDRAREEAEGLLWSDRGIESQPIDGGSNG